MLVEITKLEMSSMTPRNMVVVVRSQKLLTSMRAKLMLVIANASHRLLDLCGELVYAIVRLLD